MKGDRMKKTIKLNLKNDIIFKAFFSRKGNEKYLIDFLEALLEMKIKKIEIKEDVNLEQLGIREKGGRIDLQATLNDGIIVDIEMQIRNRHNIEERAQLYASKIMSREALRGEDYRNIKKVIVINILGYNMFDDYEEYIHKTVNVLDKHRDKEFANNIEYWFIELPKFRKAHKNLDSIIDQWLLFIDDEEKELVKMAEARNQKLQEAREEMTYLTGEAAVRRMAELNEMWKLDYNTEMSYAKEEGIQKGIEEGIQKGIEEGRKKGIQEGRKEGKKEGEKIGEKNGIKKNSIEIAKKLLKMQMPINQISEITNLTEEEIKKLK